MMMTMLLMEGEQSQRSKVRYLAKKHQTSMAAIAQCCVLLSTFSNRQLSY